MQMKILVVIILAIFLNGCATAMKGRETELHRLKNRIAILESDLRSKEQEIENLEDELEKSKDMVLSRRDMGKENMSLKQIQIALKKGGFYKGSIDGKSGPMTIEAIKAFQKANGLKPDGIAGTRTKAKLIKYLTD